MPERAQVVRYANALTQVFTDARFIHRTVHMHAILEKRKGEAYTNELGKTAVDTLVEPRTSLNDKHLAGRMLCMSETKASASQVVRAHCCIPACRSKELYAVVGPTESPIAGINIYDPVDVFACSPPMLVVPSWPGAGSLDYRLQTSCKTPDNIDRHEIKVETKNKRLRVIVTAFNKYNKQVGTPQKYFFNFKSNGLVSS